MPDLSCRMLRTLCGLLLAVACCGTARTQAQACHVGDGDADARSLRAARTCDAAYKLYKDCLWGSGADIARADIVNQKCGAEAFLAKLTPAQKAVYNDKLAFCGEQFQDDDGSLARSEAVTCGVDLLHDFVTDPAAASKPLPLASFDCSKAASPLEKAVCGNRDLGRADLLLATAYKPMLRGSGADRGKVIASQRSWNTRLPQECHLTNAPASAATIACLLKAYRQRAARLSACSAGADVGCLDSPDEEP